MKKSTQWDIVGIFALIMSFVSFFILFLGRGPMEGVNLILIGLGNPLLMVVFLFFGFMSFIFGYLENRKEEQRQLPNAP